jgi:hypothetical protein
MTSLSRFIAALEGLTFFFDWTTSLDLITSLLLVSTLIGCVQGAGTTNGDGGMDIGGRHLCSTKILSTDIDLGIDWMMLPSDVLYMKLIDGDRFIG